MSHALTLAIHVSFVLLWIGSAPALALILRGGDRHLPAARQLWYGALAGMIGATTFGTLAIMQNSTVMKEPWMHIKLTAVLFLISLTIALGRAFGVASRERAEYTPAKWLPLVLGTFVLFAIASVFLVELRIP